MIRVDVARGKATGVGPLRLGAIKSITVKGHSGQAEHGKDIVCAAASVTIYTAAGALSELCGAPEQNVKISEGYFKLPVPDFTDPCKSNNAQVIMEAAYIGFKQIEASYPGYVKVEDK